MTMQYIKKTTDAIKKELSEMINKEGYIFRENFTVTFSNLEFWVH